MIKEKILKDKYYIDEAFIEAYSINIGCNKKVGLTEFYNMCVINELGNAELPDINVLYMANYVDENVYQTWLEHTKSNPSQMEVLTAKVAEQDITCANLLLEIALLKGGPQNVV